MREIKFRALSVHGKWVYWNLNEPLHDVLDMTTCGQFTGLHDKNGKEIWEGDIISFGPWSDGKGECIHEVKWSNSECGFKTYEYREKLKYSIDSGTGEVLGNIYENKEILK